MKRKRPLKDIPVTKNQIEWLKYIKKGTKPDYYKRERKVYDMIRTVPTRTREKLVAHGFLEVKFELTELGNSYALAQILKEDNK